MTDNVRQFPISVDLDVVEHIARIAHEVNREYCRSIGDNSLLPWDEAPEWQKESVINGVTFLVMQRDAGPEASHDNWATKKLLDGWTWGPVKSDEKKKHPCMIPFDKLPAEQRTKDYLFLAVVRSYLSATKPA